MIQFKALQPFPACQALWIQSYLALSQQLDPVESPAHFGFCYQMDCHAVQWVAAGDAHQKPSGHFPTSFFTDIDTG